MAIKLAMISTKGGTGKTTCAANIGGLLADLGQRVLLIDGDTGQPGLSSYYQLKNTAEYGLTGLLTLPPSDFQPEDLISETTVERLHLIYSDDPQADLQTVLLNSPDGRMRLKARLEAFDELYDFIIIDTRGSVGPLQDGAAIAADIMLSPIPPEMLSAREFVRGTLKMLERLKPIEQFGFPLGNLYGVINRLDNTTDAQLIARQIKAEGFRESKGKISVCNTIIPAGVAYRTAATQQTAVHNIDKKRASGSERPCGREVMTSLAHELFPHLSDFYLDESEESLKAVGVGN